MGLVIEHMTELCYKLIYGYPYIACSCDIRPGGVAVSSMAKGKRSRGAREQAKMLEVLEQFRVIYNTIRRHYAEVQRRAGITGAHLWALAEVARRPRCTVGDLARALAVHQSTASHLVRQLERLGLITRQRYGPDQRQVQLLARTKGLQLLRRAPRPRIGVLQRALTRLPASALHDLHAQLARLIGLLGAKNLAARATPLSQM